MRTDRRIITWIAVVVLGTGCGPTPDAASPDAATLPTEVSLDRKNDDPHGNHGKEPTTLYIWASDQDGSAPDFLAVIDFDRKSRNYGEVLKTIPLPPPGNFGNEPHHCHTSNDQTILACGGLLSVLKGQDDIFFFDIKDARNPKLIKSTRAPLSSITDDFLPLPGGGFLVTNMGSASAGPGGRLVEFDKDLNLVTEHPSVLPADGTFNPHGIDADFSRNLLVTSDFVNPASTLNIVPGNLDLRSSLRFWDLRTRTISRSVFLPDKAGTMDVKLIPGDKRGRAVTVNMFTGLFYTVDPTDGSYEQSFDTETITPYVATPIRGGMPGLIAMPRSGRRLIFATFMAGQVGMLDISDPDRFKQVSVVSLGTEAGPHSVHLTHDDKRLIVTDYFLNQDGFGKVHMEGDHKVRVFDVKENSLTIDPDFRVVDFNTVFPTGPARPHGIGMK